MRRLFLFTAVTVFVASPVFANETRDAVARANADYEEALKIKTSPQTTGEYLSCSALWGKWALWLDSASDKKELEKLRPELSVKIAKERKNLWYDKASEEILIVDQYGPLELQKRTQRAEQDAEKVYQSWINPASAERFSLPNRIATC